MRWLCHVRALAGILIATIMPILSGCQSMPSIEGPPPAFDTEKDLSELQATFGSATSISDYYKVPEDNSRKAARDRFVAGRLVSYDLEFAQWASQFALNRAETDSILDITGLALSITTGIAGGRQDKAILAGISSLLSGSRLSIDKNFFDQKTVHALIAQMNAQRKAALVPIMEGLSKPPTDYPLTRALADLQAYYMAGTLEGALQGIQEQAASKAAQADKDLQLVTYGPDSATQTLLNWIYPNFADFDENANAVDSSGNVIPEVAANKAALIAWKSNDAETKNAKLGDFLIDAKYASARARATAILIKK
jgi:hypothetical protein